MLASMKLLCSKCRLIFLFFSIKGLLGISKETIQLKETNNCANLPPTCLTRDVPEKITNLILFVTGGISRCRRKRNRDTLCTGPRTNSPLEFDVEMLPAR